jgi:transcription antitermination factor NusG
MSSLSSTIITPAQQVPDDNANWYVIKTKQNAEKRVQERLETSGFTVFLPLYQTIRQWSDRKKKIKTPLIPSHLFVYCSATELRTIYATRGIVSVLSEFGKPAVVREHEINNLRIVCSLNLEPNCVSLEKLQKGAEMEVTEGPFTGLIGVVTKTSKGMHVHIIFKNLGIAIVLKNTQLLPLSTK